MASTTYIRPILIWFLVLGLFAVAIITGPIMMAEQNGSNQTIGDDASISAYYKSVNNSLASNYKNTTKSEQAFSNSTLTLTGGIPFVDSIWGIWKTLKAVPITIYQLTADVFFERIFGDNSKGIVFAVMASIILITIIFAIVILISRGESG